MKDFLLIFVFYLFSTWTINAQNEVPVGKSNWMGANYDAIRDASLNSICFPGTHDSGAYELFKELEPEPIEAFEILWHIPEAGGVQDHIVGMSETQSQTFKEQLSNGIRYLDLRVIRKGDEFYTFHTLMGNNLNILIKDINDFLQKNEKEIVVIKVAVNDYGSISEDDDDENSVKEILKNSLGALYYEFQTGDLASTFKSFVTTSRRAIFLYGGSASNDNITSNYDRNGDGNLSYTNADVLTDAIEITNDFAATDKSFLEIQFNRPFDETDYAGFLRRYIQQHGCKIPAIIPYLNGTVLGPAASALGLTAAPASVVLQNFAPVPASLKEIAGDSRSIIKDYFDGLEADDKKPNLIICDYFEEVPLVDLAIAITLDEDYSQLTSDINNISLDLSTSERFSSIFECGLDGIAAVFFLAAEGAEEAAQFIDENFPGATGEGIATAFKAAGYGAGETGKAISKVLDLSPEAAKACLDAANYTAEETEKFFEDAEKAIEALAEEAEAESYLAGKKMINWTEDAANTSAQWMEGVVAAGGEWAKEAGNDIIKFFGGGSSHNYECPDEDVTSPSNGVSSGPVPKRVDQYRLSLVSIQNIDSGDEGNDELEVWGAITVQTNMFMQEGANPFLFNQSCRDATSCELATYNFSIGHYTDFFISSDLIATSGFNIEFLLFEEDGGTDDPFKRETLNIGYRNGMGFPLAPGQKRYHTIILVEDGYTPPQKIAVRFSIQRINNEGLPQNPELLTVRNNNQLYTRSSSAAFWTPISNSGNVKAATYMNDGSILGVGTNGNLYHRASLNSNWILIPNSSDVINGVIAVTQLREGTILGVGTDNKLYTRSSLYSDWTPVSNTHGRIQAVTELHDGRILGVGMDYKLYTRATLNSNWKQVPNRHGRIRAVTQMQDGSILGVGMDHRLYIRTTLNSNWKLMSNSQTGVIGVSTEQAPLKIGDTHAGGIVFYLAKPGEDLNGDGIPDKGLIAAPSDQSSAIKWSMNNAAIPNLEAVTGGLPLSNDNLEIGNGAFNTTTIVQDYNNSKGDAARLCDDLVLGGFSDWFLPSIGELNLMYRTIGNGATGSNKNLGAFNGLYWSSSVGSYPGAWRIDFGNGGMWNNNRKTVTRKIRAVRVF